METREKEEILKMAQDEVAGLAARIQETWNETKRNLVNIRARFRKASDVDRIIESQVLANSEAREKELAQLASSPYFVACEIDFGERGRETVRFAKFNYSEANIFSWTAPLASIRFETPGEISYRLPNGQRRPAKLYKKDQFMIVDRLIRFMAREKLGQERQLIHQERLMRKKGAFVLPEIVEQMEKRQDEVIRADYRGSYLISGPAGSGKTTLALHRAAYLALSPDTAAQFQEASIIVFVHDASTRAYFSGLLPELGINNAEITIFGEWALAQLGLSDFSAVNRYGSNETERDLYEYAKSQALAACVDPLFAPADLARAYRSYLSPEQQQLFEMQLAARQLDRFDLTLLLRSRIAREGSLKVERRVVVRPRSGKERIENRLLPLEYSLIIIDEAENYLAEQIKILKSCADKKRAILYVGDLAQRTRLGTIRDWQEVGEEFRGDRRVELFRVYRNTREILSYLRAQAYDVAIPDELRSGPAVEEIGMGADYGLSVIKRIVDDNVDKLIGILHHDSAYLAKYRECFLGNEKVHVLSIEEAQGVEFDTVIYFKAKEAADERYSEDLRIEKQRIRRDLAYVAMTRAMERLVVLMSED